MFCLLIFKGNYVLFLIFLIAFFLIYPLTIVEKKVSVFNFSKSIIFFQIYPSTIVEKSYGNLLFLLQFHWFINFVLIFFVKYISRLPKKPQ